MKIEVLLAIVAVAVAAPPPYGSYSRYYPHPAESEVVEARSLPIDGIYRSYDIKSSKCPEDEIEKRNLKSEGDYEEYGKNVARASPTSAETSYDISTGKLEDEIVRRMMPDEGDYSKYGKITKRASHISAEKVHDISAKTPEDEITRRKVGDECLQSGDTGVERRKVGDECDRGGKVFKRASPISAETSYDIHHE